MFKLKVRQPAVPRIIGDSPERRAVQVGSSTSASFNDAHQLHLRYVSTTSIANKSDDHQLYLSIRATGSMLVSLSAILILLMPLTEYFWHFDHFLRGGEDFEFGLLAFFTILCLAMLLVKSGESRMNHFFDIGKRISLTLYNLLSATSAAFSWLLVEVNKPRCTVCSARYSRPIQI